MRHTANTTQRGIRRRSVRVASVIAILAGATAALVCRSIENGAAPLAVALPTPSPAPAQLTSPTQVVYKFVKDSSGTHPGPTSTILLGFEPNGQSYLYAVSAKESLSYHGQWSYSGGQMSLAFNASDFKFNVRFPLRLDTSQVTMPFQVLSKGKGESYWERTSPSIESGIFAVYLAARADNVSGTDALKRAFAYAQSQVELEASADFPPAIQSGGRSLFGWASKSYGLLFPMAYAAGPCQNNDPDQVKHVSISVDVVHIDFCSGPDEWLYFGYLEPPGNDAPLSITALTGDPRVFIDPKAPGDSSSDPPSKTALIISPFTEAGAGAQNDGYQDPSAGTEAVISMKDLAEDEKLLQDQNYAIDPLVNQDAGLQSIISHLSALHNPGILDWEGHGVPGDVLITYDHSPVNFGLSVRGRPVYHAAASAWYDRYLNNLKANGLGDLVSYDHPPGAPHKSAALSMYFVPVHGNPFEVRGFIGITPVFWKWMAQKKSLDLSRSLALMNACFSANTPDLAQALKARSFFGWNWESGLDLAIATTRYLFESLSRPTHSAEESYYNLLRVARTRHMIYKEDRLLNGAVAVPANGAPQDSSDLANDLHAYGWDGSKLIDYGDAGWDGTKGMNPGQVWWLLFTERWSPDSQVGANNVKNCFNEVWGGGHLGNAFKYMFCHNANVGSVPTRNEVAYAIYLLTGTDELGFGGTKVPRWTLDDGR